MDNLTQIADTSQNPKRPFELYRERRAAIRELRAAGCTYQAIADYLGVSRQRAHQLALEMGAAVKFPKGSKKIRTVPPELGFLPSPSSPSV